MLLRKIFFSLISSIWVPFIVREDEIHDVYWKCEQNCRKFTKMLAFDYMILIGILFTAYFIYSIYFILLGKFDPSALLLPYYMIVPFDTRTIYGWYLLWLIQCMMSASYAVCVLSTTMYFVSCCLYICTICQHFKLLFDSLELYVQQLQDEKCALNSNLRQEAQRCLHQAVEIHVKVYE